MSYLKIAYLVNNYKNAEERYRSSQQRNLVCVCDKSVNRIKMDVIRKFSSVVLGSNTSTNEEESVEGENEAKGIIKEDIKLPNCFKHMLAFVLYNVFTEKECKEYIRKTEKKGYDLALVNVGGGLQMKMKDVRNSSRCIWDSDKEADRIWQRIKSYIPETWGGRQVMGLNERLRFLRYNPGEYFKTHMDGQYRRDNGERSFITIQLYLNEGFKGGSTTFFDMSEKESIEVVPKTGMVLVFQHNILHEGSLLKKGVKYSMRTDVMYAATITQEEKKNSVAKKTNNVEKDAESNNETAVEQCKKSNHKTTEVEQHTEQTQDIDPIEKTIEVEEKTEISNIGSQNDVEEAT